MTAGLLIGIYILMLAVFVGIEVISKVPTTLHTPLMSGTNAIHGIILVGAIIVTATADTTATQVVGFFAVLLSSMNVFGGFVLTDRMLQMFRKRGGEAR